MHRSFEEGRSVELRSHNHLAGEGVAVGSLHTEPVEAEHRSHTVAAVAERELLGGSRIQLAGHTAVVEAGSLVQGEVAGVVHHTHYRRGIAGLGSKT